MRRVWAALSADQRKLAIETLVIAGLIVVVAGTVYVLFVHTIKNTRPLAGANVRVTATVDGGSELSFMLAPGHPGVLVGTSNSLVVYESRDNGVTWRQTKSPVVPGSSCGFGWPRTLAGPNGREYLAFLAGAFCGDNLRPSLFVSSRPGPGSAWTKPVRVAPHAWKYGFDDAPDLALDRRSGRLHAIWSRGLGTDRATVETSSSADGGRTWAPPRPVSPLLVHPHLPAIAVGADGSVYAAGIDAHFGIWVVRSTDGGRTWTAPRRAAALRANPSADCGQAGYVVLPNELRTCTGPKPALLVRGTHVFVVYADVGANGTQDVLLAALDASLHPLFHTTVTPPDRGKAEQFVPAATVDATSGTIWACWYDTTFDPHAHRSWFTCSASKDGRTWAPPERAAAVPSRTAFIAGYEFKPGLYPALVAAGGTAHAFWVDTRADVDIYTASMRERQLLASR